MLQFGAECFGFLFVDEVVTVDSPTRHGVNDTVDDLLQTGLSLGRAERAAKVLLRENVGGVERPRRGDFDVELLEGDRTITKVANARVSSIPHDLVVRVTIFGREEASDSYP